MCILHQKGECCALSWFKMPLPGGKYFLLVFWYHITKCSPGDSYAQRGLFATHHAKRIETNCWVCIRHDIMQKLNEKNIETCLLYILIVIFPCLRLLTPWRSTFYIFPHTKSSSCSLCRVGNISALIFRLIFLKKCLTDQSSNL